MHQRISQSLGILCLILCLGFIQCNETALNSPFHPFEEQYEGDAGNSPEQPFIFPYTNPVEPTGGQPNDEAGPTTTIPMPDLKKGLIATPDAQGNVVFLAQEGAYDPQYGLMVKTSSSELARYHQKDLLFPLLKQWVHTGQQWLMGNAYASNDVRCFENDPEAVVLEIEDSGAVLPQVISQTHGIDDLNFYYFDKSTCKLSAASQASPNRQFLFLGNQGASLNALTSLENQFFYLDETGSISHFKFNIQERLFEVQGDFEANYLQTQVSAEYDQIFVNPLNQEFVLVSPEDIVSQSVAPSVTPVLSTAYAASFTSTVQSTSESICSEINHCRPTKLKLIDGRGYFGTIYEAGESDQSFAKIFELYDYEQNQILYRTDFSLSPFRSTHSFDVVTDEGAVGYRDFLVVFELENGQKYLGGQYSAQAEQGSDRYPFLHEEFPFFSRATDVIVLKEQEPDDSEDGEALIAFRNGDDATVMFLDYDLIDCEVKSTHEVISSCSAGSDGTFLEFDYMNEFRVSHIQDIKVAKDFAYILADNHIYTLDLKIRRMVHRQDLTAILGEHIEFRANSLYLKEQGGQYYLFISAHSLEGILVLSEEKFQP